MNDLPAESLWLKMLQHPSFNYSVKHSLNSLADSEPFRKTKINQTCLKGIFLVS